MHAAINPMAPRNLLTSWLAAAMALPLAVVTSVAGQGLGAVLGGATWIGITLPLHLQPWALVNEPTLNFASTSAAWGYWLGSLILPAVIALTAVHFLPRPKSVCAELTVVQTAFAMAAVGLGWLPLIDPVDGHLARWLALHHAPSFMLLIPPLVGAAAVLPAVFRLLAFQRAVDQTPGPLRRMSVPLFHLLPPALLWIGLGSTLAHGIPVLAASATLFPVAIALLAASIFSVDPWVFPLEPGRTSAPVLLAVTAMILGALLFLTGRPLPDRRAVGLLWARPNAFNNVRPWVRPIQLSRHAGAGSSSIPAPPVPPAP